MKVMRYRITFPDPMTIAFLVDVSSQIEMHWLNDGWTIPHYIKACYLQLTRPSGITLRWESYRLQQFVKDLAEEVFTFQDKVDELLAYNVELTKHVESLESCKLDRGEFTEILEKIQKI